MLRRTTQVVTGAVAIVITSGLAGFGQDQERSSPSLGFSTAQRAAQVEAETRALAVPTPARARAWLRTLTEEPHVAGTPADHKTALFVRDKLQEWGWDASIVEYEVLLNYPENLRLPDGDVSGTSLELVRPDRQKLPVLESFVKNDKDSVSGKAFPAFHGYGASGTANAQVVYANYARPEDFDSLERMGIDVRGKIVLARYGELFRGLKVRNAQKRGAVGILIYSDPADDGYAKGDVYPGGPFRPGSAIQRGSVQFLSLGPGDPSTPNGPSIKGAKRLPIDPVNGFPLNNHFVSGSFASDKARHAGDAWEKETGLVRDDYFASIPALPISYDAARPILEALAGDNVPSGWQGGLPFAYHVGPGPAEVRFSTTMHYELRPIWNVIAKLKGEVEPDRWVMVGNHRDAWVYGAVDPGSGSAATLEMCRALGTAVKNGWKPRRTIVYASWDAEEYGLVGSTEWAEEHEKTLDEKAVLMLNVDSAVAGTELDVDGVPSLRDLLLDSADAVTDVRTGRSLRKTWVEHRRARWISQVPVDLPALEAEKDSPRDSSVAPRFSPQMDPLGSGSDYTAFVDHLGIPAVDVGFSGRYGVYHSIYDNFHWMETQGDPEFLTHTMAARLYTVFVMRAAAARVVPLTFTPYAEALGEHLDDLRRMVERKARASSADPSKPPFPFKGVAELSQSIARFADQAKSLDRQAAATAADEDATAERLTRLNDALSRVERAFLLKDGLPDRPWFKHAVYAPGLTTGYASWPLPGVRQAIATSNAEMLAAQVSALVERIDAATAAMKDAESAAKP
ncbi:M28 family metallopeptidase [Singulisphaera acidiphila]|uniref:Putative aminopeptidase n=1 Tax=Singulisphaera acidiphila (strain ATCC BAA-1392 / DSM 18658 / VKM B-2454 / MOB10) TaxID=886293 RepID=L0DRB8_SINAD|nr:M28 family metallopeptidase [Singulisphaera acidiphila]AGA30916.1 putative aminopeptidase [Singulisphaera acidiphila DSM 18658]